MYVKDTKDPIEVQPPGGDRLFIILCVDKSRDHVPFTLLDDLPLNLHDGPAAGPRVSTMYSKLTSPL